MTDAPNFASFLARNDFTEALFESLNLKWADFLAIHQDYVAKPNADALSETKELLLKRLARASPNVHSTRGRVKDPEHLLAKIVRKAQKGAAVTPGNYRKEITDLVGIRVLHLYKRDWVPIHNYILNNWELDEDPKAYFRPGDSESLIDEFRQWGLKVDDKKLSYRSIHYLIKSKEWRSDPVIAEVQVKTVFEEAWSEIDHLINYPHPALSAATRDALIFFNRIAGTADELASMIERHYSDWELSAIPASPKRTHFVLADLATFAQIIGVEQETVTRALGNKLSVGEEEERVKYAQMREAAKEPSQQRIVTDVLSTFYGPEDSGLSHYTVDIDGQSVRTSIFTSDERVGMNIDARDLKVTFSKDRDKLLPNWQPDHTLALKSLRYLRDQGVGLWNAPVYRIRQATFVGAPQLEFSISDFFTYRFTCGFLDHEIIDWIAKEPDVQKIAGSLQMREKLLGRGRLLDFASRAGVGGIAAAFAFRRANEDDFAILLHTRSAKVSDDSGLLSVVPKAVHQPVVGDMDGEVDLYSTILREVYEEIFGGTDAERTPGDVDKHWYCNKAGPVQDIQSGKFQATIVVTAFGIDTKFGNLTVAGLVTVPEAGFWEHFAARLAPMWEHDDRKDFQLVSSRDPDKIRMVIAEQNWSSDALFAFCEGLLELKRRFPDLVSLPNLIRRLG